MNDDTQYEDYLIEDAVLQESQSGWSVRMNSGWHIFVPASSPITPAEGMVSRLFGKGLGHQVRGLQLGPDVDHLQTVYYRTEEEEVEFRNNERFGATAEEWLARWNEGKTVWSVSMGGLGPGYEQCIQIVAATILAHLVEVKPDMPRAQADADYWKEVSAGIDAAVKPVDEKLGGITGAQFGAAQNLALYLYRQGPVAALSDPEIKDRLIQVSKNFPSV